MVTAMRWGGLLALALAGCLPEGGPGVGERLLPGRGMVAIALPPSPSTAPPVLFVRDTTTLVPDSPEELTIPRELHAISAPDRPAHVIAKELDELEALDRWDGRGRLLVESGLRREPGAFPTWELTRYDPSTDDAEALGRVRRVHLAPDGGWLTYEGPDGRTIARGPDDRPRDLGENVEQVGFAGGALLFVAGEALFRLGAADDGPQLLASGVFAWLPQPGGASAVVVTGGSAARTVSRIDLGGSAPILRPLTTSADPAQMLLSQDGGQLALVEYPPGGSSARIRMIALDGTGERSADIVPPAAGGRPDGLPGLSTAVTIAFRPGHPDQLWCFVNGRLFVVGPSPGARAIDGPLEPLARILRPALPLPGAPRDGPLQPEGSSLFTADGGRWVFRAGASEVRLGDADHPGDDPGLPLTSEKLGEPPQIMELAPGGPLAVEDEPPGGSRTDLYLTEAPWQTRRLLVRDVARVVWGSGRLLALARKIGQGSIGRSAGSGDLFLLDLASGAETVLAHNVVEMALPRAAAGADPLAAGTPLAYLVQARVPYRYDGVWRGTLP
jgi:hypothetical protein